MGAIVAVVVAKVFSIAGIGGFLAGLIMRKWRTAAGTASVMGLVDYCVCVCCAYVSHLLDCYFRIAANVLVFYFDFF